MRYTVIDEINILWYKEGTKILHRESGPAIEYSDGSKSWYIDGKLHRLGGPAIEYASGGKSWYQHGKCHRLDGPAVENADGSKEWYLEDKSYTEAEFLKKTQPAACEGMTVEVGGIKYQLKAC